MENSAATTAHPLAVNNFDSDERIPLPHNLRDFTANYRMLIIAGLAVVIGLASAVLAWALLKLIALCTNTFFFGDLSFRHRSPADNNLGLFVILIPSSVG